jgi:hypothetical protein
MGVINPMLHHDEGAWSTERPETFEHHGRGKSIALWTAVVIVAAALGALVYYGYRVAKTQDLRITEIFGNQSAVNTLKQRADAAEGKLQGLAGDWQGMTQRITKVESTVAADARETRRYAENLTQRLHQQMTAEMDERTATLNAKIQQVESEQETQRAQVAQLEANLKQELATAREENGRNLSSVRQQEESNARDVGALSQRLDRQRIDFELTKGQTKELAPGIALQIRGTNVAHQRYSGALKLAQGGRTVWLRDQSADAPVHFIHKDGETPYELIVKDVTKKSVAGYLLTPVKPDAAAALDGQHTGVDGSNRE